MNVRRRTFLLGSSALAALPYARLAMAQETSELRVRIDADIGSLDPGNRVGTVEDNIITACCQMLVRFQPGATEWTLDAAKDITKASETEYTFELNPGQMFSGGYGEMTAEDVKFSYDRFIHGDANGKTLAYADDLSAIDSVEVTGAYTGRILLKHPSPALWVTGLSDASGAILSKKAVEGLGDGINTTLIGSGRYSLTEWRPNAGHTLERNPDFAGVNPGSFNQIVARMIPEDQTAVLAFGAEEVDFTLFLPESLSQIEAVEGAEVIEREGIDYTWIGINVEDPALADVRVRQAIRLSIDVDAILVGAYGGFVGRARSLLAPSLLGNWADAPTYAYDPAAARALLDEAGVGTLDLTLTSLNDSQSLAVAQIAQATLAAIGVNLTLNPLDPGAYWALGASDASAGLQLALIPYSSKLDPSFQTQWFLSDQVGQWNWQRWKSEEFDQLHAEGTATTDTATRQEIYVRMQQLLDESASCVWITHGRLFFAKQDWLQPALMANGRSWRYENFARA